MVAGQLPAEKSEFNLPSPSTVYTGDLVCSTKYDCEAGTGEPAFKKRS